METLVIFSWISNWNLGGYVFCYWRILLMEEIRRTSWSLTPPGSRCSKYGIKIQHKKWLFLRVNLLGKSTIPGDSSRDLFIPKRWRSPTTPLKRVTFSPSQKRSRSQNRQVHGSSKGPLKKSSKKSRSKRSWFGGTCWGSAYRQGAKGWPQRPTSNFGS